MSFSAAGNTSMIRSTVFAAELVTKGVVSKEEARYKAANKDSL